MFQHFHFYPGDIVAHESSTKDGCIRETSHFDSCHGGRYLSPSFLLHRFGNGSNVGLCLRSTSNAGCVGQHWTRVPARRNRVLREANRTKQVPARVDRRCAGRTLHRRWRCPKTVWSCLAIVPNTSRPASKLNPPTPPFFPYFVLIKSLLGNHSRGWDYSSLL